MKQLERSDSVEAKGPVLLVGFERLEADALAHVAAAHKLATIVVRTPLDAIRRLTVDPPPLAVIAAPSLGSATGHELLEVVAEEAPGARRLLVTEDPGPPPCNDGCRLLRRPWAERELDQVFALDLCA